MAKGASSKAQHMKMKPIEGPGFSLRGNRTVGDCNCGGKLILAKIAGIKGARMGRTCVGRDALKGKAEDGAETIVLKELKPCGAILGRNRGNRFGSA